MMYCFSTNSISVTPAINFLNSIITLLALCPKRLAAVFLLVMCLIAAIDYTDCLFNGIVCYACILMLVVPYT